MVPARNQLVRGAHYGRGPGRSGPAGQPRSTPQPGRRRWPGAERPLVAAGAIRSGPDALTASLGHPALPMFAVLGHLPVARVAPGTVDLLGSPLTTSATRSARAKSESSGTSPQRGGRRLRSTGSGDRPAPPTASSSLKGDRPPPTLVATADGWAAWHPKHRLLPVVASCR